ncbi:hypothetical protein D9758_013743 [Tetrapyrgos nigripes]|uniref:5-oxoprolinase n=1 Tax=Tetrapyrgos nigripes TaxID=182062 RepID=A0A8H5G1N8_9AGAR|nr:hypothetical protein D9758_013743 [Tetrapyrgos nigripes]
MTSSGKIPDHSIRICADRGGTFCDVHASYPDPENPDGERKEMVVKLLSQDPANYKDAPIEGIRRVLESVTGEKIPRGQVLKTDKLEYIRLSTTVATNALLERKGTKHALLITKGFKDLLLINNQSRPRIFDLNIRRPAVLYDTVVEIDERVTLVGYTSDPRAEEHRVIFDEEGKVDKGYTGNGWDGVEGHYGEGPGEVVRGISGEALYTSGYRSLAIIFAHSYTYPHHEQLVGSLARQIGFEHVSESAQLIPMIKMVTRGVSATADAYLTPILRRYLDGFFGGFDQQLRDGRVKIPRVEFMASDGGLVDAERFSGLKSILSGPAGGVVGYALTSWDEKEGRAIIGLDVGGTSTDVSRYAGRYELVYETTTAGVTIQSPQMDINTVAAGGGSCLTFVNGLFRAGPESAGAEPGPACYRKGGPLALTDANLLLGRLIPDFFPKIFGKSEKEPLDEEASRKAFEGVVKRVNEEYKKPSSTPKSNQNQDKEWTFDQVVYGFIKVANETMARPIRALTEARGHATGKHVLASFGGAGGQHACEIAELLGIRLILIHRYSSILSAYGLALADRAFEKQEPSSLFYNSSTYPKIISRLDKLEKDVTEELAKQGFEGKKVTTERMLNMRFEGTDTSLMVVVEEGEKTEAGEDFMKAFRRTYKNEFGFLLEGKTVVVDDIKVRGIGKTFDTLGDSVYTELDRLASAKSLRPVSKAKVALTHPVYFDIIGRVPDTPVYRLEDLEIGEVVKGPGMVLDDTQTIVIVPGWRGVSCSRWVVLEKDEDDKKE